MRSEEDLGRFREISVAEFFEKNKHILGYSNPARALVTCVKEAVDNSVTWDTPIIVADEGDVRIVEIGRLIDEQFRKYRDFVIKKGDLEKLRVFDSFSVLCFDENYRLKFRKVGTIFRHRVKCPVYRLWLEDGRFVDLTDCHSVFALKDGSIRPVKVSDLGESDLIVVPRGFWSLDESGENFDDCFKTGSGGGEQVKSFKLNDEMAKILAVFTARGMEYEEGVYLSFWRDEEGLLNRAVELVRSSFEIEPVYEICGPRYIMRVHFGKDLFKYFRDLTGFRKGRVPSVLFRMDRKCRISYLSFYIAYRTEDESLKELLLRKGIEAVEGVTVEIPDRYLAVDILYLASSLGMECITEKSGKYYVIKLFKNRGIIKGFDGSKFDEKCKDLHGKTDLGFLRIKRIEKINYRGRWVYDVSVPGCENFAAGFGPIICHNSLDACEEAGILPDILVRVMRVDKSVYRVIVEDNGPGIVRDEIPKIFGKLLYGSRFHVLKQSRGQQGIGISSAVLYAQLTTGKPAVVTSKTPDGDAWRFEIMIDTRRNEPEVLSEEIVEWHRPHGTRVELEVEGYYVRERRQSIYEYLNETSIVNPHAKITFIEPDGTIHEFERISCDLPKAAREIKPHPHGIELGTLINMLRRTRARDLKSFLKREFVRIGEKKADEILDKSGLRPDLNPREIGRDEALRILNSFREVQLPPPPTDCLSPIGESLIVKSLMEKYNPEFVCAVTRKPCVYSGHPFLVEVGLAYGGDIRFDRVKILRFANRIPLLYQQGGCAITRAVESVNWKIYGLQQDRNELPVAPLVLLVHVASTNIPYTSESKEAIAQIPEIYEEIRLALQDVGRRLKSYIERRKGIQKQKKKEEILLKIIPLLAKKVCEILEREEIDYGRIIARILGKVYVRRRIEGDRVEILVANYTRSRKDFRLYEMCEGDVMAEDAELNDSLVSWNLSLNPGDEITIEYRCRGKVVNRRPIVNGLEADAVEGADVLEGRK